MINILILPCTTACLVSFLVDAVSLSSVGNWTFWEWPGWAALEACGSLLAVVTALYLAWRAATRDSRRDKKQRQAIRRLVLREIQANQGELKFVYAFADRWKKRLDEGASLLGQDASLQQAAIKLPSEKTMPLHNTIKKRLEEQLELYSRAFDADEIEKIDAFYDALEQIIEYLSAIFPTFSKDSIQSTAISFEDLALYLTDAQSMGNQLVDLFKKTD